MVRSREVDNISYVNYLADGGTHFRSTVLRRLCTLVPHRFCNRGKRRHRLDRLRRRPKAERGSVVFGTFEQSLFTSRQPRPNDRSSPELAVSGKSADERRSWKADGLRRRTAADASRTGVGSRTRLCHRALFTMVAALNPHGSLPTSRCRIPPLASIPGSKVASSRL